jgi:hypothetical protein
MVATQRLNEHPQAEQPPDESPKSDPWTTIELVRVEPRKFRLRRQLCYEHSDYQGQRFVFPANTATFTTDLASVPRLLAWFVPLVGTNLPAVLLHDALVVDRNPEGELKEPTHIGP